MTELIGGRVLRWVTGASLPGRRLFFDRATRPALRIADQILGASLLEQIAQFLMDLRTTYDGVSRRSQQIERHMRAATVLVISTADPTPVREAVRFFRELPEVASRPTAVVFNRTLPEEWIGARPGRVDSVLADNLRCWGDESRRQRDLRNEFAARYETSLVEISWKPKAPTDLDSLAELVGSDLDWVLAT
jgi:anion-transporting  ArsA/GET3 family ATPase